MRRKFVVCAFLGLLAQACNTSQPGMGSAADLGQIPPERWMWCDDDGPGGSGPGDPDGFVRFTDGGVRQMMVNIASDPFNCGACGLFCWDALGITGADIMERVRNQNTVDARCASGQCVFQCQAGRGDCDGSRGNGCEADLNTDRNHCGSCGKACPPDNQSFIRFCKTGMCDQTKR